MGKKVRMAKKAYFAIFEHAVEMTNQNLQYEGYARLETFKQLKAVR